LTFAESTKGFPFSTSKGLIPAIVPKRGAYRPHLDAGPLTYRDPSFDDQPDPKSGLKPAATALMRWQVQAARPVIELHGMGKTWTPSLQADLLSSDEFATKFVAELESDGIAYMRFGDDVHGRRPLPDATFTASRYRLGNGAAGNIGADVLSRIVIDSAVTGITRVRNPLAARGGVDPESIEAVRAFAPQAFRRQERAITAADYAEITQRHPEVQKAAATLRWTGSWYTMFITIDRAGGHRVDPTFEDAIRDFINHYRLAGYDLEINGPIFVPLDLVMQVCVKPGYFRSNVKQALLAAFSNRNLPNGGRGFFHPDNFTFGQPVYLSQLYELAMSVAGVQSVEIIRFQRWGKAANQELENGVLTADRLEVIQLDNDRNFAENGKLEFMMQGGM
jgi:predicted phage baseplate assembly protein